MFYCVYRSITQHGLCMQRKCVDLVQRVRRRYGHIQVGRNGVIVAKGKWPAPVGIIARVEVPKRKPSTDVIYNKPRTRKNEEMLQKATEPTHLTCMNLQICAVQSSSYPGIL